MDESSIGLDPNQIRDSRLNIRELARGKTILLSTHILREVEAVANRGIFMALYCGIKEALIIDSQCNHDLTCPELRVGGGRIIEEESQIRLLTIC
jgi:ABC-type multidrug transport system ATPase subunit